MNTSTTTWKGIIRLIVCCCFLTGNLEKPAQGARLLNVTPQTLPFSQDWSNTTLITASDDWNGVPGVMGYRGDNLTTINDVDPQTVLSEGTPVVDVNANQTNPNTFTTGGVAEFEIANPVVALQGSGTADAPSLVFLINTSWQSEYPGGLYAARHRRLC